MSLDQMITSKTNVILLDSNMRLEDEKAQQMLGYKQPSKYSMFYVYQDIQYIFKSDINFLFIEYPYALWNEVIGSFLSTYLNTSTAQYQIAKLQNKMGLASPNFKQNQYDYYFMDSLPISELILYRDSLENITILEKSCVDEVNREQLLRDIFCLFTIDFYMIQRDRVCKNVLFQIDKNTGALRLAPLYDYSLCKDYFSDYQGNFRLRNPIINLNLEMIQRLLKKYDLFESIWNDVINLDFEFFWNQIQEQYHLDEKSPKYEEMKSFYQEKDKDQKQVMKKIKAL